jgi:hypothetical protein
MSINSDTTNLGNSVDNPYDLQGNTLINSGTAVNPNDVPGLAQVQALVTAATGGLSPTDIASYPILAAAGGSDLLGFLQAGSGAVERTLGDKCRDSISALDYGVKGDGTTDDTANLVLADAAAFSTGKVLYLPSGTYLCQAISISASWIGESRDNTILKRHPSTPTGSFVTSGHSTFELENLTVDGNKSNNGNGCHNIYCGPATIRVALRNISSRNAKANAGWGTGAYIEGGTEIEGSSILDCSFTANDSDGLSIANISNLTLSGNTFSSNAGNGAWLNNFDQSFTQKLYFNRIAQNHFSDNALAGLVLGNFVQNNDFNTPVYGTANPEANFCTVTGNTASGNGSYGFACSGWALAITGNVSYNNAITSASSAGILFNCIYSLLNNNAVYSNQGGFGIDAGGTQASNIENNTIAFNLGVGLNLEGSPFVNVRGNFFYHNSTDSLGEQISLSRYGAGGFTDGFNTITSGVNVDGNFFLLDNLRIGIYVHDNPDMVSITNNKFFSGQPTVDIVRCVYAIGASVTMHNNRMLNTSANQVSVTSAGSLEIPDILEQAFVNSTVSISDLHTTSMALVGNGVAYCTLVSGGSGYVSQPTISFTGGGGSGAAATAIISASGAVTGIKMTSFGMGYTSAPSVVIAGGGGTGASATVQWKLSIPESRELSLLCLQSQTIVRAGKVVVENPALTNIAVPASGMINLVGYFGQWYLKSKNF